VVFVTARPAAGDTHDDPLVTVVAKFLRHACGPVPSSVAISYALDIIAAAARTHTDRGAERTTG